MSVDNTHSFASDNQAAVHPELIAAIAEANAGHAPSYGADPWTERAERVLRQHFGAGARGFFVFNGTGANVAAIDALTKPFEAVVCTDVAHLFVDECGAPERIAGAKLLSVGVEGGKLRPDDLARWEQSRRDEQRAQPRVVSITQATELGTVYTADETRAIADTAHRLGMLLHVDGARLANAAAFLNCSLGDLTTNAGVDVVSLGGTKNGLLLGEAVVFLRPELAADFAFTRKQLGQLASKMRFIAVQFEALLAGDLWLRNAAHANSMARRLADAVAPLEAVSVAHPVESNAVFARLDPVLLGRLVERWQGELPFHIWDEASCLARWMCSWDTTPRHVDEFAALLALSGPSQGGD